MSLTIAQRLDSLKARTAELEHWRDRRSVSIDGWTFDGEPIAHRQDWPHRNGTVHFQASAKAPADWPLERKQAYFDWAKSVVDPMRGVHPGLEAIFDTAYAARPAD